jgi:hypothetical protein
MPFSEFWERASLIEEFRTEDWKNQMKAAAFAAYLMGNHKEGQTFDKYLVALGLEKPIVLTPEQKKAIVERAHSTAARVMELDKQNRRERHA